MDDYNNNVVKKQLSEYLERKLLDTISLMINNKIVSKKFIHILDIEKFKSIFELAAKKFNCNIDYISHKKTDINWLVTYECSIYIKPSQDHKVTFLYSESVEEDTRDVDDYDDED